MNKNRIIISALILLLALVILLIVRPWGGRDARPDHATGSAAEIYTCPMHPSVVSDRPGACPVCGMALVRKSRQVEVSIDTTKALREVSLSPAQRIVANVSTVAVARRALSPEVAAVGIVTFAEPLRATVAARFRGRIERLYVGATGRFVPKGAPLFALYSPDLISAQKEFLVARGMGDDAGRFLAAARDRLTHQFGLIPAQIDSLERSGTVRTSVAFSSPLEGTVIRKDVQEGQYVEEGTVLYELADLRRVWCVFDVYENDLRFVRTGMAVAITTDAYPGETFTGTVTLVEPTLNPETRTVRVRTELANPGGRLKPNMFVNGRIAAPAAHVLAVPTGSILSTGKRAVVWVETGENRFSPRTIVTGASADGFTEVLSGLHAGEMIAATGGFLLDSESQLSQGDAGHEDHVQPGGHNDHK